MWDFWIDRGGTFTDVIARAPDGRLRTEKLLSDQPDGQDATVVGIARVLGVDPTEPLPPSRIRSIRMGTTVATNALLERTGTPTVLAVTAGFGDLLRIGYQDRPRIFDLQIVVPEPLHDHVVEVHERIAADGRLVAPLDDERLAEDLRRAHADGYRSLAVVLMHGYAHPGHERRVAEVARAVGFTQVSCSHDVSPLARIVARGDTSVVDAYLSPVLDRYVSRLHAAVGPTTDLRFMQSNGGLTAADGFRGKDAILSGPAGGVVGMVETGRAVGHERLIGLDMGGTSADVTHFDGRYERSYETEVAGVRLRTPMLQVHTVAAGGGSVLHFDGARFRVGPDSAGADPGPASYGRGGPLAVTDANVLLGRIQPDHVPAVFGPSGDRPLDADVTRRRFEALAAEVAEATGRPTTPEEVADGCLEIIVANMANAIKQISVARGHDAADYTLQCFGGAGGQHACLVAEALGIETVLVHPLAGVLSAYGMGLAAVRALRHRQVDQVLDADGVRAAEDVAEGLLRDARDELRGQGIDDDAMEVVVTARLRYAGSMQLLDVPLGPPDAMLAAFSSQHRDRFGFERSDRDLVIDTVSAEAVSHDAAVPDAGPAGASPATPAAERAEVPRTVRMWSAGGWHDAPLLTRHGLSGGRAVSGPALVVEATTTTVVEAGWDVHVDALGNLVLTATAASTTRADDLTEVDPVRLEVMGNVFMSVAEQMGATLANTAYSVNIKERLDFSCAVFDRDGALVANAPHVPVHLGSMGESVRAVIRHRTRSDGTLDMRPGDAFAINNPFDGGTHLPDVTVVSPVFDDAGTEVLFHVGSRGHHADIGGRTPGSSPPDSTTIDEEGVVLDCLQVVEAGTFLRAEVEAALTEAPLPVRNVAHNLADLEAQVAANETGIAELRRMVDRVGVDVVAAYMRHLQDYAEAAVRRVVDRLDDGAFTLPMDNGAQITVAVRVDRDARRATFDFTGTSAQDPGNRNAPRAVVRAAVLYVLRCLVAEDIPLNEGCLRGIEIIAPAGSMVDPAPPAAVVAGNTEVSQAVTEALFGAVGVLAGSQGTMNNLIYGNDRHQNYETLCGGTGAGRGFDGASAVHSHMTNTRLTDPEVLEARLPVRVRRMQVRAGSGGEGRHRGGDGVIRALEFLEPMTVTIVASNRRTQPFGLVGGGPGASGIDLIIRADGTTEQLAPHAEVEVAAGDVIEMHTPGGGGHGAPDGPTRPDV